MRKVSISIGLFQNKFGDEEALRIAKRIGADAVDFNLCDNDRKRPHDIYGEDDATILEYYRHLKEVADEIGLEICQTHGRIQGFKDIPEEDDNLIANSRIDCMATAALGAKFCVVHSVTTIYMGPEADPKKMRDLNFEMFTRMLPFAKEYGVIIASETFGDAVRFACCDFFGQINEFLMSYNRVCAAEDFAEHFKICVDTGHSNKAMRFGNPKPGDVIRLAGQNLVALHLNDNDTLTDQHKTPLTGTIDWNDVFDALDEIGYSGYFNMELELRHFGKDFEIEEAAFAIKVLRNMLKDRYGKEN